jgi:hypothetical protein
MSTTSTLSKIMTAAHRAARRMVETGKVSYRAVFAKALAREWRIVREAGERLACNLGLPVASCIADRAALAPAPIAGFRVRRYGNVRLFFGEGAQEAAAQAFGAMVGARFDRERAAGRRAIDWA